MNMTKAIIIVVTTIVLGIILTHQAKELFVHNKITPNITNKNK